MLGGETNETVGLAEGCEAWEGETWTGGAAARHSRLVSDCICTIIKEKEKLNLISSPFSLLKSKVKQNNHLKIKQIKYIIALKIFLFIHKHQEEAVSVDEVDDGVRQLWVLRLKFNVQALF